MRPVLTAEEMRAVDAQLIQAGVPGIVLMENAGRGAAHLIGLRGRPRRDDAHAGAGKVARGVGGSCVRCADERALGSMKVAVVCGVGNNGGDGSVVARHLLARGADVQLFLTAGAEELRGDARTALAAFAAIGGQVKDARGARWRAELSHFDLVVDAVLGTGVSRSPEGEVLRAIEGMNDCGLPVVALDVPSGLDATTGGRRGACVRAEHTVTFGFLKTGLLTTSGFAAAGRVTLSHLGVPARLPDAARPSCFLLEEADVRAALVPRDPALHKVQAGRVAIVGGSPGMGGAPNLSGRAALRAGAGLATVFLPPEMPWGGSGELAALMTKTSAAPFAGDALELLALADALVVGPGLGRTPEARIRVQSALGLGKPTVLDADGLRVFAGELTELAQHPALVLTPHAGEAAALLGTTAEEVERDRFGAVRRLARASAAVVLLKGPRTLIAEPSGTVLVSAFGTPALATAGSGDVLAGIIAGLWASGHDVEARPGLRAAWLGAALHGLTAELWSEAGGDAGLLATDLIERLPEARARLL